MGLVSLDPQVTATASTHGLSENGNLSKHLSEEQARQPTKTEVEVESPSSAVAVATKNLAIVRSSKFRHIEGHLRDRSSFIRKFPSLSSVVPGDSNAFQVCDVSH